MAEDRSDAVDDERCEVELVPELTRADVTGRLSRSIEGCSSFKAAIAYWTVDHEFVSRQLANRLSGSGFLCVDVNPPTDLDRLDRLSTAGANVFLHLRAPNSRTEDTDAGNLGMPKHLMHAKFLIFDFEDGESEIWSGSHNWTRRALLGPNVEVSLILKVHRQSRIYDHTCDMIYMIQKLCTPFLHRNLKYYKFLQRSERAKPVPVIELEGSQVDTLSGTAIELFGTDSKDLDELDSTSRGVVLAITDSNSEPERLFLYSGKILQRGVLGAANRLAAGIEFSERRHAFRVGRRYPELVQNSKPRRVLDEAYYFVTVEILSNLTGVANLLEMPEPNRRWQKSERDPLIMRMNPEDIRTEGERKVIVRVPANGFSPEETLGGTKRHEYLTLEERRAANETHFVSRKILVDSVGFTLSIENLMKGPGQQSRSLRVIDNPSKDETDDE